jgi:hypothetical protein
MEKELEKALDNFARNGELGVLGKLLGEQFLFAFGPKNTAEDGMESEVALAAKAQIFLNSQKIAAIPVFSSLNEAETFFESPSLKLLGKGPFKITKAKGQSLLFSAAARGLSFWLNPKPDEREKIAGGRLFSPSETLSLIGSLTSAPSILVTSEKNSSKAPAVQDLDLSRSRTLAELCDIYHDESPSEISIRLSRLVEKGIVDSGASPFNREERLYEPLAAFYLGFESRSARGREFREWFKRLITTAYFERGDLTKEFLNLVNENRELKKELNFSESFKQKVKREYQKLKTKMEEEKAESAEAMNEVLQELATERTNRSKDWITIESLYQKVAFLENDIIASEEWPYPTTLEEVLHAAVKLYSSKLVVAPGKNLVEVSDLGMEKHQGLIAEAIKLVKALALTLYPMKFNFGNLNPTQFKQNTGLDLTIPNNKDISTSTMCTRRVDWRGKSFVCNNYLQGTKDNCRLLIHFKLLDDERKILVSHLTAFAISGLFKLVT